MYGTQTGMEELDDIIQFENDVKMYGTQTKTWHIPHDAWFENDVKMYGTQTQVFPGRWNGCLRMM